MAAQVDQDDLNELLSEICTFLTNENVQTHLSPQLRKQAEVLITKTKHQLQELSKINAKSEHYGAYVDMDPKSNCNAVPDNNSEKILYSSLEDELESDHTSCVSELNPSKDLFADLPAKDLSRHIKCGSLGMKIRVFFKMERAKSVFAGVHTNSLIIYSNEQDDKPLKTFHLQEHRATPGECKSKNGSKEFHLISTKDKKKTTFIATTDKDMLQWITHINRCNEMLNNNDCNISATSNSEQRSEPIYHDIETMKMNQANELKRIFKGTHDHEEQPPELPSRRPAQNMFPEGSRISILLKNQQTVTKATNQLEPFTDEEDDDIYEKFIDPSNKKELAKISSSQNELVDKTLLQSGKPLKSKPQVPAGPTMPKSMLWEAELRRISSSSPEQQSLSDNSDSFSDEDPDKTYELFRTRSTQN